ncbi:MAG: type II toxin-antitoxin system RelE/ParE family toxin [Ignavibacteriales bacterium]|nr:type II toxin-antitoxin system RelE/ParE family toxin [Ignavibacteriales bacterium]
MYSLELKERVIKDFNKIPQNDKIKIWDKLQKLKNEPRMKSTRKLTGRDDEYRIRFGNYRVIYQIDDLLQKVLIIQVGHRKEIYK